MLSTLTVPLVGLAFEPQSPHSTNGGKERRSSRTRSRSQSPPTQLSPARPSPPGLAWFPVESTSSSSSSSSSFSIPSTSSSSSSRRSILNPETPAFEPLSPPEDSPSSAKAILTSPNRRRTLELPPSPPDSPPNSTEEPLLSFARPKSKASRGRAPTRSSSLESRSRSSASTRRSRAAAAAQPLYRAQPITSHFTQEPSTIIEEKEEEENLAAKDGQNLEEDDDERFLSLPLLRLRHRLSTSLTLSTYPASDDKINSVTSLPSDPCANPNQRRRRSFPPGTVWAEQSHYRLYALQKSKADRTSGVGYWKRWEGVELE
ncbi:hypothetical protein JCM3765_003993 [Sporobolomyces pararoseus]